MGLTTEQKIRIKSLRRSSKTRELTPDELNEIATIESMKGSPGRPRKMATDPNQESSPAVEGTTIFQEPAEPIFATHAVEPITASIPIEQASSPATPKQPKPKPPKPPRLDVTSYKGDWRNKYRRADDAREDTCKELADAWCVGLAKCIEYVESNGGGAVMSVEMVEKTIHPACVLTADKFLPQNMSVGPEVKVAIGSTFILGQAALRARAIKKQRKMEEMVDPIVAAPMSNGQHSEPIVVNEETGINENEIKQEELLC